MNNNTSYETQAIDLSLLSVLDITKEGKVVSVEKWVELWTLVFQHINKIDAFCVDMQATLDNWHASEVALNEIIEDMQMKYASLSTGFTHYGEAPPQNPHIKFWVRRMEDIATHCFITNADIDILFNPESPNAQSGIAVEEALSGYVVAEVGKGLSSNDFTNEDKEKLYSALQNENIDKTYNPESPNAQSGIAVEEAKRQTEAYANKTFASAIRNTVSGDIVKVCDVSPIEHELEVKVKSRNKIENYVDFSTIASVNAVYEKYCTLEVVDDVIIVTPKSDNLDLINLPALNVLCPNIPSDTKATFYFEVETEETAIKNNAYIATPPKDVYQGIETLIECPWSDYSTGYAQTYLYLGTSVTKPFKIKNLKIGIPTDEPTIEDLTTVSVTAQGKNLLNREGSGAYDDGQVYNHNGLTLTRYADGSILVNGTSVIECYPQIGVVTLPQGTYYMCGNSKEFNQHFQMYSHYKNSTGDHFSYDKGNGAIINVIGAELYTVAIRFIVHANTTINNVRVYPQVELGTVKTEYEPYVEPFTVSANADGTVKGLMSISPSMMLMTDTADVTIDLVYNADTKMYIDNKFNELATALLNA